MNCVKCGALISINDVKCPYCQADNEAYVNVQKQINNELEQNEKFRQKFIKSNFARIFARVLLAVNIMLVLTIFALAFVAVSNQNKQEEEINQNRETIDVKKAQDLIDDNKYLEMVVYVKSTNRDYNHTAENKVLNGEADFYERYLNLQDYLDTIEKYLAKDNAGDTVNTYTGLLINNCLLLISYKVESELNVTRQNEIRTFMVELLKISEDKIEAWLKSDYNSRNQLKEELIPVAKKELENYYAKKNNSGN